MCSLSSEDSLLLTSALRRPKSPPSETTLLPSLPSTPKIRPESERRNKKKKSADISKPSTNSGGNSKSAAASVRSTLSFPKGSASSNSSDSEDDDDEYDLVPTISNHIRWHERPQRPRQRLMPSFTKKCLDYDSCPSTSGCSPEKLWRKDDVNNSSSSNSLILQQQGTNLIKKLFFPWTCVGEFWLNKKYAVHAIKKIEKLLPCSA